MLAKAAVRVALRMHVGLGGGVGAMARGEYDRWLCIFCKPFHWKLAQKGARSRPLAAGDLRRWNLDNWGMAHWTITC